MLKERSSVVEGVSTEWVGSSSSNTAFSLSCEDGCEEGVGMLMWLMKVYVGAFIVLMLHLLLSLWKLGGDMSDGGRFDVPDVSSFGEEYDDEWDDDSDGAACG